MTMDRDEKFICLTTATTHGLLHSYALVMPTLLLLLVTELGADKVQLGFAATIYTLGYGLGAIPAGMLSDRFGSRRVIATAIGGTALGSLVLAFASGYAMFVVGMAIMGGFSSFYHPSALALISRGVRQSGRGMGYHGMGGNFFQALTPFFVGAIASVANWRVAYLALAVPGIVLGLLFLLARIREVALREEKSAAPAAGHGSAAARPAEKINVGALVLIYAVALLTGAIFNGSVNSFLTTFLTLQLKMDLFGLSPVMLGSSVTTLALLFGILAQWVGGHLADRGSPELLMGAFMVVCSIAALLMALTSGWLLLLLTIVFIFGYFGNQPSQNQLISKYVGQGWRGLGFGISFFMGFGAGSFAATAAGYIAEHYAVSGIFIMLGLFGVLAVVLLAVLTLANRASIPELSGARSTTGD